MLFSSIPISSPGDCLLSTFLCRADEKCKGKLVPFEWKISGIWGMVIQL
jgi:hypothetical protein